MTPLLMIMVIAVTAQRLLELRLSRRNERYLRSHGAVEYGRGHYPFMVALHSLWLVAILAEGLYRSSEFRVFDLLWLALFLVVQPLRYWCIVSLGRRWSTRILVLPGERLVARGPYRYFPHPNYAVVAMEILALPLVFGAWTTALLFTIMNGWLLYVRITSENSALSAASHG